LSTRRCFETWFLGIYAQIIYLKTGVLVGFVSQLREPTVFEDSSASLRRPPRAFPANREKYTELLSFRCSSSAVSVAKSKRANVLGKNLTADRTGKYQERSLAGSRQTRSNPVMQWVTFPTGDRNANWGMRLDLIASDWPTMCSLSGELKTQRRFVRVIEATSQTAPSGGAP